MSKILNVENAHVENTNVENVMSTIQQNYKPWPIFDKIAKTYLVAELNLVSNALLYIKVCLPLNRVKRKPNPNPHRLGIFWE